MKAATAEPIPKLFAKKRIWLAKVKKNY